MPKIKTHKGMAKRIKVTAGGKLLRRRAKRNHLLAHKQASTKREYVKEFQVSAADSKNVTKMLAGYKG